MSRTIRRIRDKKKNSPQRYYGDITWWTHDWIRKEEGHWIKVKKEGKAYGRGYWRFHGDRIKGWSYTKWLRQDAEGQARMKNKTEIARYLKDEDYEVIDHQPRDLSWDI